jgi:hypothetical protein
LYVLIDGLFGLVAPIHKRVGEHLSEAAGHEFSPF